MLGVQFVGLLEKQFIEVMKSKNKCHNSSMVINRLFNSKVGIQRLRQLLFRNLLPQHLRYSLLYLINKLRKHQRSPL
jgi:hypothetical protein